MSVEPEKFKCVVGKYTGKAEMVSCLKGDYVQYDSMKKHVILVKKEIVKETMKIMLGANITFESVCDQVFSENERIHERKRLLNKFKIKSVMDQNTCTFCSESHGMEVEKDSFMVIKSQMQM